MATENPVNTPNPAGEGVPARPTHPWDTDVDAASSTAGFDRLGELQRTVDKLNTIITIISSFAGVFGLAIIMGVLYVNSTIARYEVQIENLSTQLEKLESRLEAVEQGEEP
jgi:hypothetical protein